MTSNDVNENATPADDGVLRLDLALVARGVMETRAQAQASIKAGKVRVDDEVVTKASFKVQPDQKISGEKLHPFVSRGGMKLEHALKTFNIKVEGKTALDIGSSTGGFTDVLLRAGVVKIYAVDVGRDQLHESLRKDKRIVSYEGMDARKLNRSLIDTAPDIIVCDASFISLSKLLRQSMKLSSLKADMVVLFKPQFEVGKENIGKGGIVSDQNAVAKARKQFDLWLESEGWQIEKSCTSPIKGGDGNREYLIHARRIVQGWTP
ncbi:TlyA family RNA methyltransferase [Hirschia litorea]|uniref:TlyA family RNA methyltransferase n=1 Tax=Hirschia litorea TaxID=1199156 RepID=A0ABW2IJB1_9PROT